MPVKMFETLELLELQFHLFEQPRAALSGRHRNHPRNAVSTRRKAARLTSLPTRT